MQKRLPKNITNTIYDILVADGGASERQRDEFISACEDGITEFRFKGLLGFGGKFWINGAKWYVNCHREDDNVRRQAVIAKINRRLESLKLFHEFSIGE